MPGDPTCPGCGEPTEGAEAMRSRSFREVLERLQRGEIDVATAEREVKFLPYVDLGFARVDTHRDLRKGFPEVIFCPGKTPAQVVEIAAALERETEHPILATRAGPEVAAALGERLPEVDYNEPARVVTIGKSRIQRKPNYEESFVAVLCAGTSDVGVAEEAAATLEAMGDRLSRIYDVGVAGLHRLLDHREDLQQCRAAIVVAGMEGALPSVVGGLIDKPVIAVPTSVGYGASFGGIAALLAMLNSCASGVAVVNIDNGFGAGYVASLINR